jgi:ABC-type antimicrobial peptide transport system permease subunit
MRSRAAVLVGSGVAAGNAVLVLFITPSEEVDLSQVIDELLITAAMMFGVGLIACVQPARRALRIQPVEALKEA